MNLKPFLASSLLLVTALASAQKPLDIAKANTEAKRKATLALDFAWFDKHYTADYVDIGKDGRKKTKAQDIAELRAMSQSLRFTKVEAKVLGARMVGKDLIAKLTVHLVGTLKEPGGKLHTLDGVTTIEETWTKVGGLWKQRLEKTLSESGKLDGKPVPG